MKLDGFLPHLVVELPGVSDPLVKQALLRTAIDFCQRSQCWRELMLPISLTDGQADYDLDPPADAEVFLLLDAWVGMQRLKPLTLQRKQVELPLGAVPGVAMPTHFSSSSDRQSVTLYPSLLGVLSSTALAIKACYVPKATATTLPDLLANRYLMAVCAGVKASLMAIPGQSFSNPALSGYYRTQFDDGVLAAKLEVFYDGAPGGQLTVAPRPFGF